MSNVYKSGANLLTEIKKVNLQDNSVAVWSLGQSSLAIKGREDDGFVVVDPYLTYAIEEKNPDTEFKRAFAPPLKPEELADASGVLITHSHDDHLDPETIVPLSKASKDTVFAVPAPNLSLLAGIDSRRVIPAKQCISFKIGGFQITPLAASHTNYEMDENGDHVYLGYMIEVNGIRIFNSGDTIVTTELVKAVKEFKPHIAILPINGADYARTERGIIGNMNYREAADFAVNVDADLILPVHYDMFPNNRENPAYFVDYLFHTYPAQKFHMLVPGERFIYMA